MSTLWTHFLATIFALAVGACTLEVLPRPRAPRAWQERCGLAYLLGILVLALEMYYIGWLGHVSRTALLAANSPLALAGAWRMASARHFAAVSASPPAPRHHAGNQHEPRARWEWAIITLFLIRLIWLLAMNLSELRRTDDAFSYALSLARHVFDTHQHADYAMNRAYPKFPGLVIAYFMIARGTYDEYGINLVYLNWYLALITTFYGCLRASLSRSASIACAYMLAAIPMLAHHVILAGYADLPMSAYLTFAGIYAYRWANEGKSGAAGSAPQEQAANSRSFLALALIFTLAVPLIKTEGLVPYLFICIWTLGAAAAFRRGASPLILWAASAGLLLVGILGVLMMAHIYGAAGPGWLPPDVWNRIRPENHLAESWGPLGMHFIDEYNNWMIVGTLLPFVLIVMSVRWWRRSELVLAQFCLLILASYIDLFIFSSAFEFLKTGVTINRVYMHLVPAMMYACAVMLRDVANLGASPKYADAQAPAVSK